MNMDSLNRWMTLVANIGVLVGIVFLIQEISLSNRNALNSTQTFIQEMALDNQQFQMEYADLYHKLESPNPELSPIEESQVVTLVTRAVSFWGISGAANRNGLIDDLTFRFQLNDVGVSLDRWPGMSHRLRQHSVEYGWVEGESLMIDTILNELSSRGY